MFQQNDSVSVKNMNGQINLNGLFLGCEAIQASRIFTSVTLLPFARIILLPGGYETLAVGALPTLDLTPKSIPSTSATSRPAPKERFYIPKIYHNSYNVLLKAMKREVEKREDWLIVVNEDYFKLINTPIDANTNYTVPKFTIFVRSNLQTKVQYFGWVVPDIVISEDELKSSTPYDILSYCGKKFICDGITGDAASKHIVPHCIGVVVPSWPFENDASSFPEAKVVAKRNTRQ
uniref:uncharacterized protein LOC104266544 isoform X2 n=1 Tax=Ciona intestinalis TaxID=7719 RepID=UPI000EF4880C|nr:uncharacterized protein LOC104266544 isoform X2 [Ciona intestinalis]XP_026694165.1 uncharacterized protein LOC104266544 isoform X2 [Ciona intestinalis]|eukprot:XP_026694164.1 uncharacterized protein LOC104266544 isoform X2 [Ciona intestinalis]